MEFKSDEQVTQEIKVKESGKRSAVQRVLSGLRREDKYDGAVVCSILVPKEGDGIQHKENGSSTVSIGSRTHITSRMMYSKYKRPDAPALLGKRVISHLCKDPLCYNPYHVIAESRGTCNDRIYCPGFSHVKGSDNLLATCDHDPPCIKVTELNEGDIDISEYSTIEWSELDPTPESEYKWYKRKRDQRKKENRK